MAEVYLPSDLPGLTYHIDRVPQFSTAVEVLNGRVRANAIQDQPSYRWRLTYDFIKRPTIPGSPPTIISGPNELASFIFARRVNWDYFYYRDPDDCSVTAMHFGIGDGATTDFQVSRTLSATYQFTENIYAVGGVNWRGIADLSQRPPIIDSAPTFYVNGSPGSLVGNGVDRFGIVRFASAPGAGLPLTWTGFFYFRCHFVAETIDFAEFMHNFWETKSLEFETTKFGDPTTT